MAQASDSPTIASYTFPPKERLTTAFFSAVPLNNGLVIFVMPSLFEMPESDCASNRAVRNVSVSMTI